MQQRAGGYSEQEGAAWWRSVHECAAEGAVEGAVEGAAVTCAAEKLLRRESVVGIRTGCGASTFVSYDHISDTYLTPSDTVGHLSDILNLKSSDN